MHEALGLDIADGNEKVRVHMPSTLQIPDDVMQKLRQRAQQEGTDPDELAASLLRYLLEPLREGKVERQRAIAALQDDGLLRPVNPELVQQYVKPRSRSERNAIRSQLRQLAISPSLSEMIVEDRGAR
ncbi:MAG: hypothetical protein HY259_03340 [Chloroflexi bacterium]|nr:hypothetical protein [Chloroflexota bacterium]MBI3732475.1 hypothetical protein [Chloroflexota bacterium]